MTAIPYTHKTDIALESLQVLVAAYEAVKDDCSDEYRDTIRPSPTDVRLMTAMNVQDAVNRAILFLIESVLEDAYPRAQNNNNR